MSKKKEALVKRVVKLCEHHENFEPAGLNDSLMALNIPELQRQLKQLHWQQVTSSAFKRLRCKLHAAILFCRMKPSG
jgi:hypothetical protein